MKKLKNKSRAYVRVSTLKRSQKDSPKHQEGSIREEAAKMDIEIDHVYIDKGTGTSIMERDDVQKIIQDAKNGEFNTLFFSSLSRFSRDTLDALSLKRTLVNALGIRVISIEDFYDSGKEDNEMIFTVISSFNQKQSEGISIGSKRGIRQSARKGNFTGSFAPFGYKKVNTEDRKALEIINQEAEVVKSIFDMYVNQKMGEKAIVLHLNDVEKLPSPRGGKWGLSTIQRILRNRNYTGYMTYSKMHYEQVYDDINNLHNRRKKLVEKPREEWETSQHQTHEAIIPTELFEAAENVRLLRGGGKRGGGRILVNVFAGFIFCKECGYAMVTMGREKKLARTGETVKYHYLLCSGRRRMGDSGCQNKVWLPYFVFRDEVIEGVTSRIRKMIKSDLVAKEISNLAKFKQADTDKEMKRIEKTLSSNRKLLFEIRKRHMLKEIMDDQYEFEREMYEKEISELESSKERLLQKVNDRKDTDKLLKDVKSALDELGRMSSYNDVLKARVILSQLISKITVDKDGNADVHTMLE